MNNFDTKLKDLIFIQEKIIPEKICDLIVSNIEDGEWIKHSWSGNNTNEYYTFQEGELDVQSATTELQEILNPFLLKSIFKYIEIYFFNTPDTKNLIEKFSLIRFNRYGKNQIMRQHCDHIVTLFDGQDRGIPVLSIILNLNDDYEGGELYFWDNYSIKLGKGDILIFPSLFLFPHGVSAVTSGVRYSGVCWSW